MNIKNITIIIPIYNEFENIGLLIDDIFYSYSGINILIIDDFSTDCSINIVKEKINYYGKNISYIKKKYIGEKGLTNSIIKGINIIQTSHFIVMDGDFQHPVKNISNFINLFIDGNKIVIGERKKIIFEGNIFRILISKLGNYLINLKLKGSSFYINDPLSGFFGGKTDIFIKNIKDNECNFIGNGYKFLFDFLQLIKNTNYQIITFKYDFGKRRFGKSKINYNIYISFIKGLFK